MDTFYPACWKITARWIFHIQFYRWNTRNICG